MIRVAVLTVSDSSFSGSREDLSGPALQKRCEELGWRVEASRILADNPDQIAAQLREWAEGGHISLILTTGGTGIGPRDHTPEATREVLEKELPGLGELMRSKGLEQTPFSVLARGLAGTRGQALILNLPGSPAGAMYSLAAVESVIAHAVGLLSGETEHGNSKTPKDISKMKV